MARNAGYPLATDVGLDVLREFWPDIVRKFNLPFRNMPQRAGAASGEQRSVR
jgi:hypothetical protein